MVFPQYSGFFLHWQLLYDKITLWKGGEGMTLFDCFLDYVTRITQGEFPSPVELAEGDEAEQMASLTRAVAEMGVAEFVKACAAKEGRTLPEELFAPENSGLDALAQMAAQPPEETAAPEETGPDPDAGKHAFEVLLDCVALDDGLVRFLIDALRRDDREAFFKLSQVTTHRDLDPHEFLYWLGHREDYGSDEERQCAAMMDGCLTRLLEEGRGDVAAALLSGDKATFEAFRREAAELVHLPQATYEWYCRNYLDRDYPIRLMMKRNGIVFPETL